MDEFSLCPHEFAAEHLREYYLRQRFDAFEDPAMDEALGLVLLETDGEDGS